MRAESLALLAAQLESERAYGPEACKRISAMLDELDPDPPSAKQERKVPVPNEGDWCARCGWPLYGHGVMEDCDG